MKVKHNFQFCLCIRRIAIDRLWDPVNNGYNTAKEADEAVRKLNRESRLSNSPIRYKWFDSNEVKSWK